MQYILYISFKQLVWFMRYSTLHLKVQFFKKTSNYTLNYYQ